MHAHAAARLAWTLWTVAVLFWVLSVLLYVLSGLPPIPGGSAGGLGELLVLALRVTAFVGASTIGALVAARQPSNPFGWIIGAAGAFSVFQVFANRYTTYAEVGGALPLLADGAGLAWLAGVLSAATGALIPPTFLLLPTGRLPSRRWWVVVAFGLAASAAGVVAALFAPGPLANTPWIANPFGIADAGAPLALLAGLATLGSVGATLAAAASLPWRLRHARVKSACSCGGSCTACACSPSATRCPRSGPASGSPCCGCHICCRWLRSWSPSAWPC